MRKLQARSEVALCWTASAPHVRVLPALRNRGDRERVRRQDRRLKTALELLAKKRHLRRIGFIRIRVALPRHIRRAAHHGWRRAHRAHHVARAIDPLRGSCQVLRMQKRRRLGRRMKSRSHGRGGRGSGGRSKDRARVGRLLRLNRRRNRDGRRTRRSTRMNAGAHRVAFADHVVRIHANHSRST